MKKKYFAMDCRNMMKYGCDSLKFVVFDKWMQIKMFIHDITLITKIIKISFCFIGCNVPFFRINGINKHKEYKSVSANNPVNVV